jgi:Uncharacterised protein family (UPF0104).
MSAKSYKLLFLFIGIATMGYMVYQLGFDVIWNNLQKTGIWLLPIVGSWLVIYIMNAFGFQAIIAEKGAQRKSLPFLQILRVTISGYAINYVTPVVALGGEPYRIMELKPYLGAAKASSSVLLYSLMHMFSHIVFWLVSVPLILCLLPLNTMLIVSCMVMLVVGVGLCAWFSKIYKRGFTVTLVRTLSRLPWVGNRIHRFGADKAPVLKEVDQHVSTLYSHRRGAFYRSLIWEFAARVVGCAEIYFTAKAIGLGMNAGEAFIVSATSSLFANVLFFFPMQLGTREGGLMLALKGVGMAAEAGIFIGIVTRIREIIWIFIGLLFMGHAGRVEKTAPVASMDTSIKG